MKVLDPGHKYQLLSLDGKHYQELQFVKRCDLENPERFPGNTNAYPGTTLQSVLRCLTDRVRFLDRQIPCRQNKAIVFLLKASIWLLEHRAAKRHGKSYWHTLNFAEKSPMCPKCGHTVCDHSPERA